jgi:hypothetical protein
MIKCGASLKSMPQSIGINFLTIAQNKNAMEKKNEKKRGPKDRNYVNQSEKYEVDYEKDRTTPAKKFGASKKSK